jgi:outer membrane biosynthesis protein TonB
MLSRTIPLFPEHLRQDDVAGTVRLEGRIDQGGAVGVLEVVEASHPDFAAAAEDAVRGWTWEQALLNCAPVEVGFTIDVRFVPEP